MQGCRCAGPRRRGGAADAGVPQTRGPADAGVPLTRGHPRMREPAERLDLRTRVSRRGIGPTYRRIGPTYTANLRRETTHTYVGIPAREPPTSVGRPHRGNHLARGEPAARHTHTCERSAARAEPTYAGSPRRRAIRTSGTCGAGTTLVRGASAPWEPPRTPRTCGSGHTHVCGPLGARAEPPHVRDLRRRAIRTCGTCGAGTNQSRWDPQAWEPRMRGRPGLWNGPRTQGLRRRGHLVRRGSGRGGRPVCGGCGCVCEGGGESNCRGGVGVDVPAVFRSYRGMMPG